MKKKDCNNFNEKLDAKYYLLSEKQKHLAAYIKDNYKRAAFMNSIELADAAGVSNATVIRFAKFLDYSGYREMQFDLQSAVQNELTSEDRLSRLFSENSSITFISTNPVFAIFEKEMINIANCMKSLKVSDIEDAAAMIWNSKHVFIAGFQASFYPAGYMSLALSKIKSQVRHIESWDLDTYKFLQNVNSQSSVAVIFGMLRFPNQTIEFFSEMLKRKIPIILITDSMQFPYAEQAESVFLLRLKYLSYVDMMSSVFCLINSILITITKENPEAIIEEMKIYESYNSENYIFFKN